MVTWVFRLRFFGASSMTFVESSFLIVSMLVNVWPLPRVAMTTRAKPASVARSVCPSLDEKSHSVSRPKEINKNDTQIKLIFLLTVRFTCIVSNAYWAVLWIGLHANGRSIARIFPKVCTIFQILIPTSVTTTFSALDMKFATICTFSPAFSLNRAVHHAMNQASLPWQPTFWSKKEKNLLFS